jgi:hypothetical protein
MAIAKGGGDDLSSALSLAFWLRLRNEMHFNCIRLCDFDSYNRSHGGSTWTMDEKLAVIDQCVTNAENAGMYIIINYHDHPMNHMNNEQQWTWCNEFWQAAAPRYKDRTHVIYEANNEPYFGESDFLNNMSKFAGVYQILKTNAPNTPRIMFTFNAAGDHHADVVLPQCTFTDWTNGKDYVGWHGYSTMGGDWYCKGYQPCLDNWVHMDAFIKTSYPKICTEWGDRYFEDDRWTDPTKLDYNQYKLAAQSFETVPQWQQSWICWVVGHRPELLQKFGLDRLKPDAQSKGYYWPIDTADAAVSANKKPGATPLRSADRGVNARDKVYTIRGQRLYSFPEAASAIVTETPGSTGLRVRSVR